MITNCRLTTHKYHTTRTDTGVSRAPIYTFFLICLRNYKQSKPCSPSCHTCWCCQLLIQPGPLSSLMSTLWLLHITNGIQTHTAVRKNFLCEVRKTSVQPASFLKYISLCAGSARLTQLPPEWVRRNCKPHPDLKSKIATWPAQIDLMGTGRECRCIDKGE